MLGLSNTRHQQWDESYAKVVQVGLPLSFCQREGDNERTACQAVKELTLQIKKGHHAGLCLLPCMSVVEEKIEISCTDPITLLYK